MKDALQLGLVFVGVIGLVVAAVRLRIGAFVIAPNAPLRHDLGELRDEVRALRGDVQGPGRAHQAPRGPH